MSKKIDEAVKILRKKENQGKSRKDMICIFMTELKMTDAGASTYYYNATKRMKTEDAVAGIIEDAKDGVENATPVETTTETKSEEVVEVKQPKKKVLADAAKGPRFSMTTGSVESDEFLAQIDINAIPKFLRK